MTIKELILLCGEIKKERTTSGVFMKLTEEVGEIATEINIEYHGAYKKPSADGIKGECVDALICIADILNVEGVDVDEVENIIKNKMNKWKKAVDK
jgi:NTP pyrophosphatase (non-canonical NTP hydrolase)